MCTAHVAIVTATHHVHSTCVDYYPVLQPLDVGCCAAMQLAMNNTTPSQRKLPVGENKRAHSFFSTTLPYMAPVHQGEAD